MPLEDLRVEARAAKNRLLVLLRLGVDTNWSNAQNMSVRATRKVVVPDWEPSFTTRRRMTLAASRGVTQQMARGLVLR